ncbi:ATP-dependent nuclease [Streptomyces sp. NBC_01198]|uniref:ATP-dependent nuclease n=1 Tax=Streptomyces sp. NBC_01198 TaxID=2903769 RepID=UPI002E1226B7|nr:AAA family ATPase [Streptomyces sp. NBC_01198]
MRITSVRITAFRSILETELEACGELNVLIGKNNSGKSNILTAIRTFFDFFKSDGSVITVSPDIKSLDDWHGRNSSRPIDISLSLQLEESEIDLLLGMIASEAPQVKNAVSKEELGNIISVGLKFLPPPQRIGYISIIKFGEAAGTGRTIFSVSPESAQDMRSIALELASYAQKIESLEVVESYVDEDDWRRSKERGGFIALPPSLRNTTNSSTLAELISAGSTYADFQERVQGRYETLASGVEAVKASEIAHPVTTFSGESKSVPAYVTTFSQIIAGMTVHNLSEERKPIGQAEASRILKLKTSRGQGAVLQAIQSVVRSLLGVEIDAFSADVQPTRRSSGILAELDVDDFLIQMNGSGIREALRLILDREFERPTVLLVEEPEVHLHPALETALMQYLKSVSSDCQIFLTTHSTNFLDVGSLENVYLIRKSGDTLVHRLDVSEAEEAIPHELGIRLSSLFMFDRLVFVEGPSDEQILRTFADTLGVSFGQASLGFVTTGGARNFTHYATGSTLSFLGKRKVRTFFVLDRDERDLRDLESLQDRVRGMSEVKVLERREIENYLLAPTALCRFIEEKSGGEHSPTPEEMESALNEICERLLPIAVERRVLKHACKPIIPKREAVLKRPEGTDFQASLTGQLEAAKDSLQSLSDSLPDLIKEVESEVGSRWENEKSSMIPGDELIDGILQLYGLRFNKRTDSQKIASGMTAAEIPEEIKNLLNELVL